MDFAALMAQQIAKKKGPSPPSSSSSSSSPTQAAAAPAAKYTRKADIEAARKAAYAAEQARVETERASKAAAKRKREDDAAADAKAREDKRRKLAEASRARNEERAAAEERARRRRLGLPEEAAAPDAHDDESDADDDVATLDDDALVARLRALGEPARLFGESRAGRAQRLRRKSVVMTAGPIPTTLAPVAEKDMKVAAAVPPAGDRPARKWLFRQLASYFTMVLREWALALRAEHGNKDGAEDKTITPAARQAHAALAQCVATMTPLFRKFEQAELDDSVLASVVEIVRAAQERRYVDANDEYLRLSIGKAAWPIGVTMVGIHERSAREKLHNGERGHVMGDEVTRKYLQSIKRCLTFAQVRWPPEDVRQLMG